MMNIMIERLSIVLIIAEFFQGTAVATQRAPVTRASSAVAAPITARYRGKGTDLSKVDDFKRHSTDTGSPEYQIARLSARVQQLTSHLQSHKKDYSTRRGLMKILSQRKQMLAYLKRNDEAAYNRCLAELGIRQAKADAK